MVTLQNEFCNIFAYAALLSGSMWSLACGVTICPLFTGGLTAEKNSILDESLLRESRFRVNVMPLYMKMGGCFFTKTSVSSVTV